MHRSLNYAPLAHKEVHISIDGGLLPGPHPVRLVSVRLQLTCASLTTVVEQFTTEIVPPHVEKYTKSENLQGSVFLPGREVPSTVERAVGTPVERGARVTA